MPITMRSDLMSSGVDVSDQFGKTVRHPAENKKRASYAVPVQECEHALGIGDDATLVFVPAITIDVVFKGRDLEVVFDIDGERVEHVIAGRAGQAVFDEAV